ncbi:DUF3784 domain-containing protein [Lysinibacillus sp. NPDC097214]|uniref:DUF3784 domain-containing protein n=1 Tax=Lysinibacillus sp. NPDC097214 TaxID=3390584 RepID=UPI003D04280B
MSLNTDFKTAVVISIILGACFIISGWSIWKKKRLNIIAGYQDSEYKGDKEKLGRIMGIYSIVIGLLILIIPIGIKYLGDWFLLWVVGIFALLTLFILIKINFKSEG